MSKKQYIHNRFQYKKRFRFDILIICIVLLAVIGIGGAIGYDLLKTRTNIDSSENKPTNGKVEGDIEEKLVFDEEFFTFSANQDWVKIEPTNSLVLAPTSQYQQFHYQTAGVEEGRLLDVFVDNIPQDIPVTRVMPVTPREDGIIAGKISDQCYTFTLYEDNDYGVSAPSKWNENAFTCDSSRFANSIAIVNGEQNVGIELTGASGAHRYLIIYNDNGSLPNNQHLFNILASFKAK